MVDDIAGKSVLITGASTGIGAAAARAFAAHGARIAVHYNASKAAAESVAQDVRRAGAEVVLIHGDVTRPGIPEAVVTRAVEAFGRLDVLVNNAGGLVKRTPVQDYTDDFVHSVLALNVVQTVAFVKSAVAVMRRQGGGSIINVSSVAARVGGRPGSVIYAASKGFISTATHGWARELVGDNIRVNAVAPGIIMTPFHGRDTPEAELEVMRGTIPMKRIGQPEECAQSMLFLASTKMSSYITGQVIEVNGGVLMP